MRTLLYAINGVGLGHVARLSVFADRLRTVEPSTQLSFYSNSKFAAPLLRTDGDTVLLPDRLPPPERASIAYWGFEQAVRKYKPHMVICDTHWPIPAVGALRLRGVRTVLVLRLVGLTRAQSLLERAHRDFDLIVVPHSADEIVALYGSSRTIMQLLEGRSVFIAGPVARRATRNPQAPCEVIFSLGGGGEYHRGTESNSVATLLRCFSQAAGLISSRGISCHIARGPFMNSPSAEGGAWKVLDTLNLPDAIDGKTILVGRAGYNTCWEVLATGGRLLLVGDHSDFEDVAGRIAFLKSRNLALSAPPDPERIASVVLSEYKQRWASQDIIERAAVNVGLDASLRRIVYG